MRALFSTSGFAQLTHAIEKRTDRWPLGDHRSAGRGSLEIDQLAEQRKIAKVWAIPKQPRPRVEQRRGSIEVVLEIVASQRRRFVANPLPPNLPQNSP